MRRTLLFIAAALLVAAGAVGGSFGFRELEDPETVTETTTVTVTRDHRRRGLDGLPAAVARTRDSAARGGAERADYRRPPTSRSRHGLRVHVRQPRGRRADRVLAGARTDDRRGAARALAKVSRMPYTLSRGLYVWPFAYDVASIDDLTATSASSGAARPARVRLRRGHGIPRLARGYPAGRQPGSSSSPATERTRSSFAHLGRLLSSTMRSPGRTRRSRSRFAASFDRITSANAAT